MVLPSRAVDYDHEGLILASGIARQGDGAASDILVESICQNEDDQSDLQIRYLESRTDMFRPTSTHQKA